jgi:hypothetical protein
MDSRGMNRGTYPVSMQQNTVSINVHDFATGLYFYRILGAFGSTEVRKLVIVRD